MKPSKTNPALSLCYKLLHAPETGSTESRPSRLDIAKACLASVYIERPTSEV
jgi:hypothetical protein